MPARIGKGKKISDKHALQPDLSMLVNYDMFDFKFTCYPQEIVDNLGNYSPLVDSVEC
jgi:hypothetical protein